jgi:hypothetical protein
MEKMIYKQKYLDLKQKYLNDIDLMYRLGYEAGAKQAQQEAMQQQMQMQQQQAQQQAAMMQQAQQGGQPGMGQPGMEEQPPGMEQEGMPMEGQVPGQEMPPMEQGAPEMGMEGQAPGELDDKIAELESLLSKGEKPKILDLRKAVQALSDARKAQFKKTNQASKKVESAQRSLVKGILQKWSSETKTVSDDLEKILADEGIKLE